MQNNSRLIIVSNRLPVRKVRVNGKNIFTQSDGGLVSALNSYSSNQAQPQIFLEKTWIGAADFSEETRARAVAKGPLDSFYQVLPIFIDKPIFNKQL